MLMAATVIDASELIRGLQRLAAGLPAAGRSALQIAAFRLQAYIVAHMDETGPPKGTRSTSDQIAIRSGATARALSPGDANNTMQLVAVRGLVGFLYGINEQSLPYPILHEEGTDILPQRAFLGPGFEDFIAAEAPALEQLLGDSLVKLWRST